jgi:hypothetical protein
MLCITLLVLYSISCVTSTAPYVGMVSKPNINQLKQLSTGFQPRQKFVSEFHLANKYDSHSKTSLPQNRTNESRCGYRDDEGSPKVHSRSWDGLDKAKVGNVPCCPSRLG